jgi:hypothetical protein
MWRLITAGFCFVIFAICTAGLILEFYYTTYEEVLYAHNPDKIYGLALVAAITFAGGMFYMILYTIDRLKK